MKVLVTGANGFLGRHVVAEFLRRGHSVRALVRPAAKADLPGWGRVEVVRADLRVGRDLAAAFEGVDALVHLAACVVGDADAQFAGTVVGTERLLEAMAASSTRRLVLASSFSVYDCLSVWGKLTEETRVEPDVYGRTGYAVAKIWQERLVRRTAAERGWQLTVLRPGFIWGRENRYLYGLGVSMGPAHLVFGPWRRVPVTHVENCAHLFATATEDGKAVGQTFNVVDGKGISAWRYMGEYMRRTGVRGFRVGIPSWLAMAAIRCVFAGSRMVFGRKGKLPSMFYPAEFASRFKPLGASDAKAREVLGWQPSVGWADCLERTYAAAPEPGRPGALGAAAATGAP